MPRRDVVQNVFNSFGRDDRTIGLGRWMVGGYFGGCFDYVFLEAFGVRLSVTGEYRGWEGREKRIGFRFLELYENERAFKQRYISERKQYREQRRWRSLLIGTIFFENFIQLIDRLLAWHGELSPALSGDRNLSGTWSGNNGGLANDRCSGDGNHIVLFGSEDWRIIYECSLIVRSIGRAELLGYERYCWMHFLLFCKTVWFWSVSFSNRIIICEIYLLWLKSNYSSCSALEYWRLGVLLVEWNKAWVNDSCECWQWTISSNEMSCRGEKKLWQQSWQPWWCVMRRQCHHPRDDVKDYPFLWLWGVILTQLAVSFQT